MVAATAVFAVIFIGSFGYVVIEGWSWFDSLYMTVTTITTVGNGNPAPLDLGGKWWTIFVVAIGFGVLSYTLLALMSFVVEGELSENFDKRRMAFRVGRMTNHFVLCGFGRVGREIAEGFVAEKLPFVVVDADEPSIRDATALGYTYVKGNAADAGVLKAAGIERSRGLVAAVDDDADNIVVALTARTLRPDLFIVARANASDAEAKLRLAGANRVVSPYTIGGRRLASLAMRPTAVEFVDTILSANNGQLLLEDFTLRADSAWIGHALGELIAESVEAIVLALKRDGTMLFRPTSETVLAAGDELVIAGEPAAIRALEARL